ncbi:hypothetical protein LguiB_023006 [Lonicera macranthoides]
MSRRRLRLISSSSDEEDEPPLQLQQQPEELPEEDDDVEIELKEPTLNLESVTLNSFNRNPNYSDPVPLEISDDDQDFVDVSDNLSSPSPPPPPPPPSTSSESIAPPSISAESIAPPSISAEAVAPPSMLEESIASFEASRIPAESVSSIQASRISISNTSEPSIGSVPNNVSSPSPSFRSPPPRSIPTQPVPSFAATDCPIDCSLRGIGLKLRREWLDSCIRGLESAVPGFERLDHGAKAKLCFEQFLCSDMNYCGSGILPENVHDMHLVDLQGPFVLQVDEIVNISCPLRGRYQKAHSGLKRCLKLSMTDGVQRVFGMEFRPIKDLEVLAPAGLKVALCNVNIRHGLLMLVPEVFEVLGGLVEELEATRQRVVTEVNKPPRGKRTRTGVVPPLATRATLAAWEPNRTFVQPHTSTSVPQVAVPIQADVRGTASDLSSNERSPEVSAVPIHRENAEPNPSSAVVDVDDVRMADLVEPPSLLTGDRELPFTYLSSLSTKWAAMEEDKASNIQGKIKCFLTGVKGFQFKQRTTYELRVYVDDGSLISEILIDHNVVQSIIGHSPEEVTATLGSSDKKRVGYMKEKLKQFQYFLANFEGMMVLVINGGPLPIAIEMNQGSTVSDAWLLLRRLKTQQPCRQFFDEFEPINLSP